MFSLNVFIVFTTVIFAANGMYLIFQKMAFSWVSIENVK